MDPFRQPEWDGGVVVNVRQAGVIKSATMRSRVNVFDLGALQGGSALEALNVQRRVAEGALAYARDLYLCDTPGVFDHEYVVDIFGEGEPDRELDGELAVGGLARDRGRDSECPFSHCASCAYCAVFVAQSCLNDSLARVGPETKWALAGGGRGGEWGCMCRDVVHKCVLGVRGVANRPQVPWVSYQRDPDAGKGPHGSAEWGGGDRGPGASQLAGGVEGAPRTRPEGHCAGRCLTRSESYARYRVEYVVWGACRCHVRRLLSPPLLVFYPPNLRCPVCVVEAWLLPACTPPSKTARCWLVVCCM